MPSKDIKTFDKLSQGNFGIVYRGQLRGVLDVAIKQVKLSDKVMESQFFKEIELISALPPHPNIVLFIGYAMGPPSLLMELLDSSLLSFLTGKPEISVNQRLEFGVQIAKGLEHLHAHNILHRDLATRNCLVRFVKY